MVGGRRWAHHEVVNQRSLIPRQVRASLRETPSLTTIAVAGAAVVVAIVIAAMVASAALAFVGFVIPFVLIGAGALLLADDRPVLGWSSVGVGGVLLLGHLPLIALLIGAAAGGWLIARRPSTR